MMFMFHNLLMQNSKKDYVQDGLIYQGTSLSSSPASISLPNGEFTVEVVNELIAEHTSSSSYRTMFQMFNTNPSEASNQFGSLRNDGIMLYYTRGDNWVVTARPQGYINLGDKRTSSFVFNRDNIKSFYYNGKFIVQKQASSTFSRTDYNAVTVSRNSYFNYFDIRIYDRALTAEEIAHNYEIDKERYGI